MFRQNCEETQKPSVYQQMLGQLVLALGSCLIQGEVLNLKAKAFLNTQFPKQNSNHTKIGASVVAELHSKTPRHVTAFWSEIPLP